MTPLERAARALCEYEGHDPDEMIGPVRFQYPIWHLRRDAARAVLQAIREPSDRMCRAAWVHRMKDTGDGPGAGAGDIWRTMIDAALEEGVVGR